MKYLRAKYQKNQDDTNYRIMKLKLNKSSNMESLEIHSYIRDILMYSKQMLNMAQQTRWTSFETIECQRQELMDKLFRHKKKLKYFEKIANLFIEVLENDKQCLFLGEQAQKNIEDDLLKIRNNKNAITAYQRIGVCWTK